MAAGVGRDGSPTPGGSWQKLFVSLLLALLGFLLLAPPSQALIITNNASVSSSLGVMAATNSVKSTVRSHAAVEFLQYAPGVPGATPIFVPPAAYSTDGSPGNTFSAQGVFAPTGPITTWDHTVISLPDSLDLLSAQEYKGGEPVFIRLSDPDQNQDPVRNETVLVTVSNKQTRDSILLRLTESGPDTGVFVGAFQSTNDKTILNDRYLSVGINTHLSVSYTDATDPRDTCRQEILVDPYGLVFSTADGRPVNGATVTLWNVTTAAPADVYYDDGAPGFPAHITSGDAALGYPDGCFRFPLVRPGRYRLIVAPPSGYAAPSTVATSVIQGLPGHPYALELGSRGEDFSLNPGPALHLDLPVDARAKSLFISKKSLKDTAEVGEYLQHSLTISNTNSFNLSGLTVTDQLPQGFRYIRGSTTRLDLAAPTAPSTAADPSLSADGRTLIFRPGVLPAAAALELRYVVGVSAAAREGIAINSATATAGDGTISSNLAQAAVQVVNDLFGSTSLLMGRVILAPCPSPPGQGKTEAPKTLAIGPGAVSLRLTSRAEAGQADYAVAIRVAKVTVRDLTLVVELPELLRYRPGSASLDGKPLADPEITAGSLRFQLGEVKAASHPVLGFGVETGQIIAGEFNTRAHLEFSNPDPQLQPGATHQATALATNTILQWSDDPAASLLLVTQGDSGETRLATTGPVEAETVGKSGLGKVRLFLEDGRYIDTNEEGMYHFEALTPGSHVVQVDLDSLPKGLKILQCDENSRFAGVAHSQFFDLQPSSMGRADFFVGGQREAPETGPDSGVATPTAEASSPAQHEVSAPPTGADAASRPQPLPDAAAEPPAPVAPLDGLLSIKKGQRLSQRTQAIPVRLDEELTPELAVDGLVIDRNRIGMQLNEGATHKKIYSYIGVDLGEPGPHVLSLRGLDPFGNARFQQEIDYVLTRQLASIRVLDTGGNVADGKTPIRVRVELLDDTRDRITGGTTLALTGGDLHPWHETTGLSEVLGENPNSVTVDSQGYINFAPCSDSGSHTATLSYGDLVAEVRTYVKPYFREWIMVGLAEGVAGYNNLAGNLENLTPADQRDGYYRDGRLAFYAKGKVKGKYLLAAAYDSARERTANDHGLFGGIDPNKYYTIYGDGQEVHYDAPSKSKLYLKLDGEQFYLLYGDYQTGLTVSELSRYSRSLTGLKGEYLGEQVTATAFTAETDHAYLKDELPGDGTSGLYHLSHTGIVLNSEKIRLEVRDRFHSEVVVSSRQLSRFLDYTLDAQDGTIYFREPIFSRDGEFNPIYIVVEYEISSGADRALTGGGRVAYQMSKKGPEVGASLIREGTPGAHADLEGVDLTYKPDDQTTFKAESATSRKRSGGLDVSGNAYLAEVTRHGKKLDGKAYYRQEDGGFGLGQQASSESGTRKFGADGRYILTQKLGLNGEVFHKENLLTATTREVAATALTYKLDKLSASGGLRWVKEDDSAGPAHHATLLTASLKRSFLADRLDLYTTGEVALAGETSTDYPNRLIFGGEYGLTTTTRLFAAHEITSDTKQDTQNTRFGFKANPWSETAFQSSLENRDGSTGQRTFANLGLTQGWKINERLRLDFGLERSQTTRQSGESQPTLDGAPTSGSLTDNFTASSAGATYKDRHWSLTGRAENRNGSQENKSGLLWGFYREETPGFGLSSVFRYFDTDRANGNRNITGELEFSLARRPSDSPWTILDKAKIAELHDSSPTLSTHTTKLINNLSANYLYDRQNQLSLSHGLKYVIDTFDGGKYQGFTQMLGVEYRHDLNREWDVGLHTAARITTIGNNALYSAGASLGHSLAQNIWLSVGYNFSGFRDDDFSAADYTSQGIYIKCRAKFDQFTARQLLAWWEK